MACEIQTLDGCKIEVATAVPVADCATVLVVADYDAVADWTTVGAVDTGGLDGQGWDTTEFAPLSGGKKKTKATFSPGTLTASIAWDKTDVGMIKLETAYLSKTTELAARITYPNGSVYYSQGLVTKLSLPSGGQNDLMMRDMEMELNHQPTDV